jgi:surfactin synthase thioesterase subunit
VKNEPLLLAFHQMGGAPQVFTPLSKTLGSSVEFAAVDYGSAMPLTDAGAVSLLRDLDRLLDGVAAEIKPERRVLLLGYSMGALVANRFASSFSHLRIEAQLVLSMVSPQVLRTRGTAGLSLIESDIELLAVIESRYGRLPEEIRSEPDLVCQVLRAVRRDARLLEALAKDLRTPAVPMLTEVIWGQRDQSLDRSDLEAWASRPGDRLIECDAPHLILSSAVGLSLVAERISDLL